MNKLLFSKKYLGIFLGVVLILLSFSSYIYDRYGFQDWNISKETKNIIVIIPGAQPVLPSVFSSFYSLMGVDNEGNSWAFELGEYISENYHQETEVMVLDWSGGVSKYLSIKPASQRLISEINNLKSLESITFFGKSLGGHIIEHSLPEIDKNINIQKIVTVATPNIPPSVETIKRTNVYSQEDNFHKLANKLINFGRSYKEIDGENIIIPNMNHSHFNENIEIYIADKKYLLFDYYIEKIQQESKAFLK